MAQVTLKADTGRELGTRPSRRLRQTGQVPAVVYGQGEDAAHVAVNHHDLVQALHTEAGSNVVINLEVDGGTAVPTLVRSIDRHPYKSLIRHVDFVRVDLSETVEAEVSLHFVGTPVGAKEGGVLIPARNSVQVEALPTEIPAAIEVDVSALDINDQLRVSDLPPIENVTILDDPEELLVSVSILAAEPEPEPEVEEGAEEGEDAEAEGEPEAAEQTEREPEES
jgi:large subunit ribosomal protein L25